MNSDLRTIVFGGWALEPAILSPVFGKEAAYIDTNLWADDIIHDEIIDTSWQQKTVEFYTAELTTPAVVAAWSTGVYPAWALRNHPMVRALILFAPNASFCKTADYPHGQPGAVPIRMSRQLTKNRQKVLEQFYGQCGFNEWKSMAQTCPYTTSVLQHGLTVLSQMSLLPVEVPNAPVKILHGKSDTIIPPQAGIWLAEQCQAEVTLLEGTHIFWLNATETVKKCIL